MNLSMMLKIIGKIILANDEIQDYIKCDFKRPLRESFEETNQ